MVSANEIRRETPCGVEAEVLLDIANGATSSRKDYSVVTDKRVTPETRPGNNGNNGNSAFRDSLCIIGLDTCAEGTFARCEAAFAGNFWPLDLRSSLLAAVRDMGSLRSAVARGMEKRVRDPEKRLLVKQGPEDAASMLFPSLQKTTHRLQIYLVEVSWVYPWEICGFVSTRALMEISN